MAASARWNTLGLVAGMVAISLNQRPALVASRRTDPHSFVPTRD